MYEKVITFENEEDFKKAQALLKDVNATYQYPLKAFCEAEAEFRLFDLDNEEIAHIKINSKEGKRLVSLLKEKLYDSEFLLDGDVIDDLTKEVINEALNKNCSNKHT